MENSVNPNQSCTIEDLPFNFLVDNSTDKDTSYEKNFLSTYSDSFNLVYILIILLMFQF